MKKFIQLKNLLKILINVLKKWYQSSRTSRKALKEIKSLKRALEKFELIFEKVKFNKTFKKLLKKCIFWKRIFLKSYEETAFGQLIGFK